MSMSFTGGSEMSLWGISPHQTSLSPHEQEMFNMALSKTWVESEHAICMWKRRFPWLHSILMIMKQSTQKQDLSSILEVINACLILHNFLIKQNEEILDNWMNDEASDVSDAMSDMDETICLLVQQSQMIRDTSNSTST